MQHFDDSLLSRGLGSIQDLLLVGRFGIYHHRRVFWESYMIDRYSSITLDRPFAVTDKAIQIGFPANANDDELESAEGSGAFTDLNSFCAVSSLTAVAAVTARTT
ncbi:hypothetical protein N7508_004191 [Penicillium antarcticum]|uniref:uncharacterized protein n=1 Tax=Penicillium antarcticum TaxID=416450 RepID=UPI002394DD6D|nr:uncharacterized protein N7508_004191 [Penicillium antarcticum]KAJ5308812.1 hypothetical protein N7508_004191 [Penicillium antarcticum]